MKKTYEKPLVCCEKFDTGEIVTNSEVYAESVKKKIAKMEKTNLSALSGEKLYRMVSGRGDGV